MSGGMVDGLGMAEVHPAWEVNCGDTGDEVAVASRMGDGVEGRMREGLCV